MRIDGATPLQRLLSGEAAPEEAQRFGALWQGRVQRILRDHCDDPEGFVLHPAD